MPDPLIPQFVRDDLQQLSIDVPDDELTKLARYLDLLLEVNQQVNLTGIRDRDQAWRRHIVDSLTLLAFIDDMTANNTLIDVGSGGGLPGIPVAITRPDLKITLLEATGKKADFLQRCVDELALINVTVVNDRAETVGQMGHHRQRYDAAVCRAVGPMAELLEYTLPLVRIGGHVLAMKGPKAEGELRDAATALDALGSGQVDVFDAYPEKFQQASVVVIITKQTTTPKLYPRLPGSPRHSPI